MGLADVVRARDLGRKQVIGSKRPIEDNTSVTNGHRKERLTAAASSDNPRWRPTLTRTARRKQHKDRLLQQRSINNNDMVRSNSSKRVKPGKGTGRQQGDDLQGNMGSDTDDSSDGQPLEQAQSSVAPSAGPSVHSGAHSAYSSLLSVLRGASSAFADLYQQRRREEAGHSDEDDDDNEAELEDDPDWEGEDGKGELEVSSSQDGVSSDNDGGDEEDGGDGRSESMALLSGFKQTVKEQNDQGMEGRGIDLDATGDTSDSRSDGEGTVGIAGEINGRGDLGNSSERGGREEGGEGQDVGSNQRCAAGGKGNEAHVVAAVEDHFSDQFDRVLTDAEVARLSGREGRAAPRFEDAATSAPWLATWQDAMLEALPGSRLPQQQAPDDLAGYGVRERLIARWREEGAGASLGTALNTSAGPSAPQQGQGQGVGQGGGSPQGDFSTPTQRSLFATLNAYCDVLHPCCPYPTQPDQSDPDMDAVLLHVVNHCTKAADRVRKNNDRLKAGGGKGGQEAGEGVGEGPPRDQGFVRPKVLLLLPYRNTAYRVVLRLLRLAVKETRKDTIQNKERFLEDFGPGDEELSERERRAIARKPADHRTLFDGNMDDHFRLGIKLTRGAVRLYTDFFQSDIIVCSPLGLATKLGEGPGEGGEHPQDFLASIELAVLARADVMLMQNWSHVTTVFEALNLMPHQQHGTDIMRVREWALSGWSRLYRQTVLLSSFASPEMNALMVRRCANHAGCVRLRPSYPGVLQNVLPQVRQVFERLPSTPSLAAELEARFQHFKQVAWPRIKETGRGGGQLIYVPSYFDFVRVRNFLRAEAASFLSLSEYTERADAARARAYFFDGRKQVLLYTERAQFYNRNRIRGIKDILFYQLPEHAHLYAETLNLLEGGGEGMGGHATVSVLFARGDVLRLERVVGSSRSAKMLRGSTSTYLFC